MVDVSGLLLFVSSLSFSLSLLLSWVSSASLPFAEAISSSSLSDELSTLNCSRPRKYVLHFGSLFLFLSNQLGPFCS